METFSAGVETGALDVVSGTIELEIAFGLDDLQDPTVGWKGR